MVRAAKRGVRMLTNQEHTYLTPEERKRWLNTNDVDKAPLETELRAAARARAAAQGVILEAPKSYGQRQAETDVPNDKYAGARNVANVLAFLGWASIILGGLLVVLAALGTYGNIQGQRVDTVLLISFYIGALAPPVGMMIGGVLFHALAQVVRTNADSAEATQALVGLMRSQR